MSLVVKAVHDDSVAFEKLKSWRESYIGFNPANESDFSYWESIRDKCSYTFAFYYSEQLMGGVRFTPLGHGITMGERQLDLLKFISSPEETMEVNRLVIDEQARGKGLMRESLNFCFQWTVQNTIHTQLIALCAPKMVPMYRRIGASVVRDDIRSERASNKLYSLINLNLKEL